MQTVIRSQTRDQPNQTESAQEKQVEGVTKREEQVEQADSLRAGTAKRSSRYTPNTRKGNAARPGGGNVRGPTSSLQAKPEGYTQAEWRTAARRREEGGGGGIPTDRQREGYSTVNVSIKV